MPKKSFQHTVVLDLDGELSPSQTTRMESAFAAAMGGIATAIGIVTTTDSDAEDPRENEVAGVLVCAVRDLLKQAILSDDTWMVVVDKGLTLRTGAPQSEKSTPGGEAN